MSGNSRSVLVKCHLNGFESKSTINTIDATVADWAAESKECDAIIWQFQWIKLYVLNSFCRLHTPDSIITHTHIDSVDALAWIHFHLLCDFLASLFFPTIGIVPNERYAGKRPLVMKRMNENLIIISRLLESKGLSHNRIANRLNAIDLDTLSSQVDRLHSPFKAHSKVLLERLASAWMYLEISMPRCVCGNGDRESPLRKCQARHYHRFCVRTYLHRSQASK